MKDQSIKKAKKSHNPRHLKLRKTIGNAFQTLRRNAGFSSSEKFANTKELNRGMYGRYEAGSVDMKITTLLDIGIAHGLSEEDIFNKEFLSLGTDSGSDELVKKRGDYLIGQVRNQVRTVNATKADSFDDHDIETLHMLLLAGWNPASKKQLIRKSGLKSKTPRFEGLLNFLEEAGWMAMTDPGSPNSPKQKYYTTEAGKAVLAMKEPRA